ncbi:MAG: hypothetical protein ABI743_04625 [bacterium]
MSPRERPYIALAIAFLAIAITQGSAHHSFSSGLPYFALAVVFFTMGRRRARA